MSLWPEAKELTQENFMCSGMSGALGGFLGLDFEVSILSFTVEFKHQKLLGSALGCWTAGSSSTVQERIFWLS